MRYPRSSRERRAVVSSTVNEVTLRAIDGYSHEAISTSVGILSILLLLTLLVTQEVWHAKAGPRSSRRIGAFYSITVPLFMSFGVVIGLRLLDLIPE
jgi:hypothetical protein